MPTRRKKFNAIEGKRAAHIGQWFRNRRVEIKRSLRECARISGYGESTHSELERGLYDPMSLAIKSIPGLAMAYNIRPEAILWRLGIIEAPATNDWSKLKKLMEADAQEKIEKED